MKGYIDIVRAVPRRIDRIMIDAGDDDEFIADYILRELRESVGGDIELIPCFNEIVIDGTKWKCVAFCNEHGKLNRLPMNNQATEMWWNTMKFVTDDYLVGDIAVVYGDETFMQKL